MGRGGLVCRGQPAYLSRLDLKWLRISTAMEPADKPHNGAHAEDRCAIKQKPKPCSPDVCPWARPPAFPPDAQLLVAFLTPHCFPDAEDSQGGGNHDDAA